MSVLVRVSRWVLRRALGAAPAAEQVLGDLEEEFGARPAGLTRDAGYAIAALRLAFGYGVWHRLRQVGGVDVRPGGWARDIRYGGRALLRRPTYLLAGVTTLALGIGADTAIFSVVWHSLLRPLPFPAAERIVILGDRALNRATGLSNMSVPDLLELRDRTRAFDAVSAFEYASHLVAGDGEPADLLGLRVNAGFFGLVGLPPRLGRDFREEDDRPGATPVVVLSDGLWRDRFGADPDIIGRTIRVDLEPRVVIGVADPAMTWRAGPQLWTPWAWDAEARAERGRRYVFAVARRAEGVAEAAATAELAAYSADLRTRFPQFNENRAMVSIGVVEWTVGWGRRFMTILAGAAALVLLVACVNVANLMLARASGRRAELAMRRALGASRFQAARVFLAEALVLAGAGVVLSLLVAWSGVRLFLAMWSASIPRAEGVAVNGPALAFAVLAGLGIALFVGLVPMLAVDGGSALRASGRGAVRASDRIQSALVVVEVALGVVLVAAAGLLANTAARLSAVDLGVAERGALAFRVSLPALRYGVVADAVTFFEAFTTSVEALPGVASVGLSTRAPLSGGTNGTFATSADPGAESLVEMRGVTPGWFDATGQRIVEGRLPTSADARPGTRAIVVNRALARSLFPEGDAIGRELRDGDEAWTIVGVVSDVRDFGPAEDPRPTAYWPYGGDVLSFRSMSVLVRADGASTTALLPAIRERLRALDADLPLEDVATLETLASRTLGRERRATLALVGAFAILAVVLALVGIYAVMAFVVEERRREVGVRVALGATRTGIVRLVCGRGLQLAAIGIAIGLAGAFLAGRAVAHLLWQVRPADPLTLAGTALLFLAIALAGAALPARRAAKVEVTEALRAG